MSDSRNLGNTAKKMIAKSKVVNPSTKTPKPAKKVFGPSSNMARNTQAGTNR